MALAGAVVAMVTAVAALVGVVLLVGRQRLAQREGATVAARTAQRLDRLADSMGGLREVAAETYDQLAALTARIDAAPTAASAPAEPLVAPRPRPLDQRRVSRDGRHRDASGLHRLDGGVRRDGADVASDGVVRPNHDLANAATAVVTAGDRSAWLFPGAPVVADFATRFHDVLTLHDVLGPAFAIDAGGGGRLQLVAPAALTATTPGHWRIISPRPYR